MLSQLISSRGVNSASNIFALAILIAVFFQLLLKSREPVLFNHFTYGSLVTLLVFVISALFLFITARINQNPKVQLFFILLIFVALTNFRAGSSWALKGAHGNNLDVSQLKRALLISQKTPENIKVAVSMAGVVPYFGGNRYFIDLLGKCDKYIARTKGRRKKFWPGHTKWDFVYSIQTYWPDLILHYWSANREEENLISKYYRIEKNGIRTHKKHKPFFSDSFKNP